MLDQNFNSPTSPILQEKILSVHELNQLGKQLLEDVFPQIWVSGEISNFYAAASGHWYFTLKDEQAQIKCACFRGSHRLFKFTAENGMQVLVRGKLTIYEQRGDYQLIIEQMELAGEGLLLQQYEQLKTRLQQQGLFDPRHKQKLPAYPQTIGIITSKDGAALQDILNILSRRAPILEIVVYHSLVQGTQAARQLIACLQMAQQQQICDVLIIGRGGGSLEDLYAFNDEALAHAIFECKIPVISAVGHETDFTICDFVADIRAPTPSAAAELVSPDIQQWQQYLDELARRLQQLVYQQLHLKRQQLVHLSKRLKHPSQKLAHYREKSKRIEHALLHAITIIINREKNQLSLIQQTLDISQLYKRVSMRKQELVQMEHRLLHHQQIYMQQKHYQLAGLIQKLESLSPLQVMSRGYALIYREDASAKQLVKSARQLRKDDEILIQFADDTRRAKII